MINLVKYFNDNTRDGLWKKNGESYKRWFGLSLTITKSAIDFGANEKEMNQLVYRLVLGYFGVGKQGGLTSGLVSEDAMMKGVKKTADHLLGTTQIGKFIHEEFEKNNFDIDYMVNVWLYENLWLWQTIKVTSEEHRKDNIIRNEHSIEDKLLLKHYKKVSNLLG
tara:strand:- start:50 stop:544 length:495 start_codon:yes stop_codon:yes gene_type:complete